MATRKKTTKTKSEVENAKREAGLVRGLQEAGIDPDEVREIAQSYAVELEKMRMIESAIEDSIPGDLKKELDRAQNEVQQIKTALFGYLSAAFPTGGCGFSEAGLKFSLSNSVPTYEVDYHTLTEEDLEELENLSINNLPLVVKTLDPVLIAAALEYPEGSEEREQVQALIDSGVIVRKIRKPSLKAT